MNHEQWTQLQAATKGHTPGPWATTEDRAVTYVIRENGTRLMWEGWCVSQDMTLAAAAPDLLAEVERLRGWIAWMERNEMVYSDNNPFDAALSGAEVPK